MSGNRLRRTCNYEGKPFACFSWLAYFFSLKFPPHRRRHTIRVMKRQMQRDSNVTTDSEAIDCAIASQQGRFYHFYFIFIYFRSFFTDSSSCRAMN